MFEENNYFWEDHLVAKNFLQEISVFIPGKIKPGSATKWPQLITSDGIAEIEITFVELDVITTSIEKVLPIQAFTSRNFLVCNPDLMGDIIAYVQAKVDEMRNK